MKEKGFNRFAHYENSVQTPSEHVRIFDSMFQYLRRREAYSLREDFCGTFLISCEWVRSHPKRKALGLDLDQDTVEYGFQHGYKTLTTQEKGRVQVKLQNVLKPTKEKFDVIGAGNFSFYIFKSLDVLVEYFTAVRKSLNKDGIFVLEMAGGPGFIITAKEQKTYRVPKLGKFTYYWDQKRYDPISHEGLYAIHFKDRYGKMHKDVFVYDWRVWTIPEVRYAMKLAGFKDSHVYWETTTESGEGSGEWVPEVQGTNDYSWIAFVVGTV